MFSPHLSLKYITYFFLSVCSLPVPCLLPCVVFVLPSSTPQARGHPCPSLLPSFPPLVLRSSCPLCVPWLLCVSCCVLLCSPSPCLDPSSVCAPLKLSGGLLRVLSCVSCRVCPACPSLVSHQAQDGVAVWADAPRICPRPCLLLPMCCRVFRCLSRGLSCLLPCVVWWQ